MRTISCDIDELGNFVDLEGLRCPANSEWETTVPSGLRVKIVFTLES